MTPTHSLSLADSGNYGLSVDNHLQTDSRSREIVRIAAVAIIVITTSFLLVTGALFLSGSIVISATIGVATALLCATIVYLWKSRKQPTNSLQTLAPIVVSTQVASPQIDSRPMPIQAKVPEVVVLSLSTVQTPAVPAPVRKVIVHSLPEVPSGVIRNGYGEYVIYRIKGEIDEKAVAEERDRKAISAEEYEVIYDLIDKCRGLQGADLPEDRHNYLTAKIQEKLGSDVRIAFIPRVLYELFFLKECIEEDIANNGCCHWRQNHYLVRVLDPKYAKDKKIALEKGMKEGFWQISCFNDKDYKMNFAKQGEYDYRHHNVIKVAGRLNEMILSHFQGIVAHAEGFTYEEIQSVFQKTINFYTELANPESAIQLKVLKLHWTTYPGIAKQFALNFSPRQTDPHPHGIKEKRHEQVLQKIIQLECSSAAINSMILYRGSNFLSDGLIRETPYSHPRRSPQSLSYGLSYYAGAIFDGGASASYYMRKGHLEAQAIIVPLKDQHAGKTPFYVPEEHSPIIQLLSQGEYFHPRTLLWQVNQEASVYGIGAVEGVSGMRYKDVSDSCKSSLSQETIEKRFAEYQDQTYILASANI